MRAAIILGSILVLAACNNSAEAQGSEGGGEKVRRDFQVGAFDRVSLGGSQRVVVAVGGAPSVRAEGDARTVERLEIKVENGELKIGMRPGNWTSFTSRGQTTIYVTAPRLAGASLGGSGEIRIDKVENQSFDASVAGSGEIEIGRIAVREANLSVAGSGTLSAAGQAGNAKLSMTGSGDIAAAGLESRTANVALVGSGDVKARVMETAQVAITGSGDVVIEGPARCTLSKRGSGDLRCTG
jgi:hypothetical protein